MSTPTMTPDEVLAVMERDQSDAMAARRSLQGMSLQVAAEMDRESTQARAAVAALVAERDAAVRSANEMHSDRIKMRAERDALREALAGVIRIADRKTDEFDAARAALAGAGHE